MEEKHIRMATIGIAAALSAVAVAAGLQLVLRPGLESRQQAARLDAELGREVLRAATVPALAEEIRRLESQWTATAERLPLDPRLDDFVAEAGRAARRHRVRILQMQPGNERLETDARVLPVRISVEARFERIYAWMVDLETAPRLVRIETMQARARDGSNVRADLQVLLYMGSNLPPSGD